MGRVGLQWWKRVDADDAAARLNATVTYRHNGDLYELLSTSPDGAATSVSVSTSRQSDGSFVSQLRVSRVTVKDVAVYVCVVTGRYGVRSYRTAALIVRSGVTGQYLPDVVGCRRWAAYRRSQLA